MRKPKSIALLDALAAAGAYPVSDTVLGEEAGELEGRNASVWLLPLEPIPVELVIVGDGDGVEELVEELGRLRHAAEHHHGLVPDGRWVLQVTVRVSDQRSLVLAEPAARQVEEREWATLTLGHYAVGWWRAG